MMWNSFGFYADLYDTNPITGNDQGERLLVGRAAELRKVKTRISNRSSVTSIEGNNGVGKTSVVLVAAHQLDRETSQSGKDSLLCLPKLFQIASDEDATEFKRKVYASVATLFIDREKELLRRMDLQFALGPLRAWLENPVFRQGGASMASFGGNLGSQPNSASGFDLQGFFNIIDRLLDAAFSDKGAVICVLDNLEILNTSATARDKLEALRDDVFAAKGIRWVVCGARGIVRSVATSPRLQGRIIEPLEIEPLDDDCIADLISARVEEYRAGPQSIPPVGVRSFEYIYSILNSNLRDALKYAGDFSLWLEDEGNYVPNGDELHGLFEAWVADLSDRYESALNVPPRAWQLFDDFCGRGGSISPSAFEEFGFNSSQSMRGAVSRLENGDLVVSEIDETDNRRKTINVTAKGWLIHHRRAGYVDRGG
ncbi:hypothetical protein BCF33_1307 [Hasllibacter halocynthiae]|uniref:AAA ATPase-like protein n=1 Tax=Hasllibacter halocynthiae TaxID=595589 RepID=A0A2T0X9X7_9RHOB|nr:MarR family winged helix-turn-helix transcriptional regulator [Hasllibacter halocynthiae]PRY95684.1 hypothetical protein BCF33_1307 [Hasllibacter halocynthiae]